MKLITKSKPAARSHAPDFFGAAVLGPAHWRQGRACEDAWRGQKFATAVAITVSDGMGSKTQAALGARAACASAIRSARLWSMAASVGPEWICRWLEAQWRFAVAPHQPQHCAATCHLLAAHAESGLVYVGLGDGLALFQEGNQPVRCLSQRPLGDFLNETLGLGVNHRMSDWVHVQIPLSRKPWIAILATDGVAADLRPEKLDVFIKWLHCEVARLPHARRAAALRRALRAWPTPGHLDDKTVAVVFNP